jgi:hypothetical protein
MGFPTTCYGINLEQFEKPVYWTLVQYGDGGWNDGSMEGWNGERMEN